MRAQISLVFEIELDANNYGDITEDGKTLLDMELKNTQNYPNWFFDYGYSPVQIRGKLINDNPQPAIESNKTLNRIRRRLIE
jgi:hypothetical protein